MAGYRYTDGIKLTAEAVAERIAPCAVKWAWFLKNGYAPHYWQLLFHTAWKGVTAYDSEDSSKGLCRFRHLVAGRRGGKTVCAAWEVAFYVLHPEEFHWDYHRKKSDRPLTVWVVTKDFPTGHAALTWFREVLKTAGLTHGIEYKENKGNHWFEFENGGFVHFRSAEDPESLRGAGLDILWMDEAAFIPTERAYEVARPALSDKVGMVITTTTPDGKNWLYRKFWGEHAIASDDHCRVEYRSIDNEPGFSQDEWEASKLEMHPLLFMQEYMAAFDSMAGRELHGDWLHYYTPDELPRDRDNPTKLALDVFIGIDPAISLSDRADRWAAAVIGITHDKTQAYLLELYADRIPFPEQIQKIQDLALEWTPRFIGIESVAFQLALVQQSLRIPGLVPVLPMFAPGKKTVRILSMSPLFRAKRIKIKKSHHDFITEWIDYDSTLKNPEDDCLDAVEIALRCAGAILPSSPSAIEYDRPASSVEEWAARDLPGSSSHEQWKGYDENLGADW